MAKILNVFAVYRTCDEYGRKVGPAFSVFKEESDANKAAAGKGWYGGRAAVEKAYALEIEGKIYLLQSEKGYKLK